MKKKKVPPYPFLLEALAVLAPETKPMFSGHAVYAGDRLLFMLRESEKGPEDNGLWLVLSEEADALDGAANVRKLKKTFSSVRLIGLLGGAIRHWLLIPSDSEGFEAEALLACELAVARDARFGRVPASRRGGVRGKTARGGW